MLVNYWADPRPRDKRRPENRLQRRRQEAATIPSPFDPLNRQFYASVDRDFDAGAVDVAPGIRVAACRDFATYAPESAVQVELTPARGRDLAADREF